ncbi:hypothetical protein E4T56_gene6006 [Termitomyces sp. T112]|nr:hypothetical protein E4T56_gene6006 [Termitomyces sp. T112]
MMNEVFKFAAYGDKHAPPPPRPYSIFDKNDIEQRTAKLREEVEVLKASLAELKAARQQDRPDVVMTFGDDGIIA